MEFLPLFRNLLEGFGVTLKLFGLTLVIAIPLGLVVALLSMSRFKPLSYLMKAIIWVVRGTPLLLQCVLITFLPSIFGMQSKAIAAFFGCSVSDVLFILVLIAFGLNYACYFAVIFEGGIRNIPRGQYEAGQVLGLTRTQIFFHVILMQLFRRILAPMSNEIITLVKDTALAKALGVVEILCVANNAVNKYVVLTPLAYAAAFYLAFSAVLTWLFHRLDKKLSYYSV